MQNHSIRPLRRADGPVPASSYLSELGSEHDALVARAAGWTAPAASPRWGIVAKRQLVNLRGATSGDTAIGIQSTNS